MACSNTLGSCILTFGMPRIDSFIEPAQPDICLYLVISRSSCSLAVLNLSQPHGINTSIYNQSLFRVSCYYGTYVNME